MSPRLFWSGMGMIWSCLLSASSNDSELSVVPDQPGFIHHVFCWPDSVDTLLWVMFKYSSPHKVVPFDCRSCCWCLVIPVEKGGCFTGWSAESCVVCLLSCCGEQHPIMSCTKQLPVKSDRNFEETLASSCRERVGSPVLATGSDLMNTVVCVDSSYVVLPLASYLVALGMWLLSNWVIMYCFLLQIYLFSMG